jgi:TrmH family RNA methyltransferase
MRKERKEKGLFVAEGTSILISARDAGVLPLTLVFQKGEASAGPARAMVEACLRAQVEVLEVSAQVMAKLAARDNPQSLLGVYRQRWSQAPVADTVAPGALWLALEKVRDPGNLGTIIRTADAVGASGLILAGTCCDPFSRECVRATMGSIFAVPLARMEQGAFVGLVKAWPGDSVGTHLSARLDFRKTKYRYPALIVMGAEGPGLSAEAAAACKRLVRIPMAGKLDSLNLAVATALVLYQVASARLAIGP